VADWGVEKFRAVLEEDYLHRRLIDGPPPPRLLRPRDHVGVQRQKDGLNAFGVAPVAGRVGGTRLAAAAERAGSRRVRITPMQKLVVLDVPDDKVEELIAELGAIGLPARPSPWRRAQPVDQRLTGRMDQVSHAIRPERAVDGALPR
jgi:sulfite reductase (ferredoxin)